jgi:hypothetical protein
MMHTARRASFVGLVAVAWIVASVSLLVAQDQPALLAPPALTPEQMEDFLLHARIVTVKNVGKGVTNTRRATLSDGQITHDAQIQTVDISKTFFTPDLGPSEINFKDTYRYNIAGYRLARLLGLTNVPMSVERRVDGMAAAVTWWVDDVAMDEGARRKKEPAGGFSNRTAGQIHIMRVFDELIANTDRNGGNLLWDKTGDMWLIDHTRAFRLSKKLKNPKLLERCERRLCGAMRELTADGLKRDMGDSLNKEEIEGLLGRRDLIIAFFDALIDKRGEGPVLYTLAPR